MRRHHCVALVLLCALALLSAETATAQWAPRNPVTTFQQQPDGVLFAMKTGTLRVQVCSDSIIRVRYSATSSVLRPPELRRDKNNLARDQVDHAVQQR